MNYDTYENHEGTKTNCTMTLRDNDIDNYSDNKDTKSDDENQVEN